MSKSRDKILAELNVQAQHEGETSNIAACRIVVRHLQYGSEVQALLSTKFHRYGPASYQAHSFYYLRPWVLPLVKELAAVADAPESVPEKVEG